MGRRGPVLDAVEMKLVTNFTAASAAHVAGFVRFVNSVYGVSRLLAEIAMAGIPRFVAAYLIQVSAVVL